MIATRRYATFTTLDGATRRCFVERRARILADGWFIVRFEDGAREAAHESRLRQARRSS